MMMRPALAVALLAALGLICGLPILAAISQPPPANACTADNAPAAGASSQPGTSTADAGPVGQWDSAQVANAAIVVAVGKDMKMPPRAWVVAVATAMTESSLTNSADATDHDSVGLFQQRPSQGWGTVAQLTDPRYAARKFYQALATVAEWQTLPLTDAAQAVQRSAIPDAYANYETDAEQVVAAVAHVASITELPGASPVTCSKPATASSAGWTQPVHAHVGSGFRTPERPNHQGVDLIAPRYTLIRAASAGRVIWAGCDDSTGNCNIDGSPYVNGCGWYVDIQHASGVATRYCHMVRKPDVEVGQTVQTGTPIGAVGTSGHSSGPHLHYEVHLDVPCTDNGCTVKPATAADPVVWMKRQGAALEERPN